MRLPVTALAASLLASTAAQAITFTYYTDRSSFEAALGTLTTETFDTGAPTASGLSITGNAVTYQDSLMRDRLDAETGAFTTFSFGSGLIGFGADFDLPGPGGTGSGIIASVFSDVWTDLPQQIPNTTQGFLGVIADEAFTQVMFREGTQGGAAETYTLDNLTFSFAAPPPPAPVPLPAGLPLLAGALAAAGLVSRRRG